MEDIINKENIMEFTFPAVFEENKEKESYINVSFPDILEASTFGVGKEEAVFMAKKLLKTLAKDGELENVTPSELESVKEKFSSCDVELITVEVAITDDEKILKSAKKILKKHKKAFEVLGE